MIEYVSVKFTRQAHEEFKSIAKYGESMSDIALKCVKAFKEKHRK